MSEKVRLTPQAASRLPEPDGQNAVRFCPKCGREIPLDRKICVFCANTGEVPRPSLPRRRKLLILTAVVLLMLILLLALDWAIRSAGPLPTPAPALPTEPPVRGTSIPVILLP